MATADQSLTGENSVHRIGWDEEFSRMAQAGDDSLLDPEWVESAFDTQDWQWRGDSDEPRG